MIFKKIGNMENVEVICHYLMYQGSSRFSAILKRASCEIDTEYFLVRVAIKVYPATHRE